MINVVWGKKNLLIGHHLISINYTEVVKGRSEVLKIWASYLRF